jgi:hypothetical protein
MYCVLFRNTSMKWIVIFSCVSMLFVIDNISVSGKLTERSSLECYEACSESKFGDEQVASNDFSLNHRNGTEESLQHSFVTPLRAEKLLRECIFDREKIIILAQTLIWFTRSTYRVTLPPLWQPSIIIAHRRLII